MIIGLENQVIHLNYFKTDMGSYLDQHEHVGPSEIGTKGLSSILIAKN